MKVEVDVLGSRPQEAYGFCGRKATLQLELCLDDSAPWAEREGRGEAGGGGGGGE